MSLSFVIGRSGTGKSKYIYNSILEDQKNGKMNTILFVPQMVRLVAEKEYLFFTNKKHISNVCITTMAREVSKNINKKELYENKKFLPELAKKMYIKMCLERKPELFNIFKNVKDKTGFVDAISSYIDVFDRENIDVEEVKKTLKKEDMASAKLEELLRIYTNIRKELRARFVDTQDEMDAYILQNQKNSKRNTQKTYFDSYNNFSTKELNYIKMLMQKNTEVVISLNLDINLISKRIQDEWEEDTDGIFKEPLKTYRKLKQMASELGIETSEILLGETNKLIKNSNVLPQDLRYLQNHIFETHRRTYDDKCENIEINLSSNLYEEISQVAKDIYQKQRKENIRYNDIVICTNNMEAYETCVKKIFEENQIPLFVNNQTQIINTTISNYILLLMEISLNGLNYIDNSKLFMLLRTGLTKLDFADVNKLENYVNEFGIKGYMYNNDFYINKLDRSDYYNLEKLNETRTVIIHTLRDFELKLRKADSTEKMTEVIYSHLSEHNIIEKYSNEVFATKKEKLEVAKKKQQVLTSVYEVLDCITILDINNNITKEEYLKLFRFGLENKTVSTIPTMLDQVEMFDLNKSRITSKKIIYIIGLNEGSLPKTQGRDAMFSDSEIEKLNKENIKLKHTSMERLNMELFNIYLTINKSMEKIIMSVPASKMTGESLRVSPLIQDIKNVLPIKIKSRILETLEPEEESISGIEKYNAFLNKVMEVNEDTPNNKIKEIFTEYNFFITNNKTNKKTLEYARKDSNLKESVLQKIYSRETYLSVSRLENFKKCPFAYYLKYMLNIRKQEGYKLSKLDMGSIMHDVLEKISRFLISKNILWQEITMIEEKKKQVKTKLEELVEEIFDTNYSKYNDNIRQNTFKQKLKKSMFNVLLIISESFNQSEFIPLGYEIEFDKDKLFAPIEIALETGRKIYLKGKIDRVDIGKINNKTYLRVIDYKSSLKTISLDSIKEGISLQLMTYMSALIENKEKILKENKIYPAALSYFTLNTSVIPLAQYEESPEVLKELIIKKLKLKGIYINDLEVLKGMDKKIKETKKSYIDANIRYIKNENKYLSEKNFNKECLNIKQILKKISEEIVRGNVQIMPYNQKSCEYCEYFTICRKTMLG